MTLRPFVYRAYGWAYDLAHCVFETTDGEVPPRWNAKNVVRVVADAGFIHTGSTIRSAGYRAMLATEHLVEHLNLLYQVDLGLARITLARIASETNAELQRELIEHYDGSGIDRRARGWDTWIADAAAIELHSDDTGTLIEVPHLPSGSARREQADPVATSRSHCTRAGADAGDARRARASDRVAEATRRR